MVLDQIRNKLVIEKKSLLHNKLIPHEKVSNKGINQLNNYIVINSQKPLKNFRFELLDLKSRIQSFNSIGIDLPTDELLQVIITKTFSDKQVNLNPKTSDYIIKNIDRSYDKIFKFIKDIDQLSLSSGKSININLIKKVLNK